MKIPFKDWLQSQPIDSDSMSLLNEAILCYQIGAYRAALVFSYLGLMRALAGRLMTAGPPSGFPPNLWGTIQRDIRDDNIWEPKTLEASIRIQPAPVFLVDDDLRQQLQYWKGRRNDAAHSKGNEISYAHVEMLWLFTRSSLGKFVVNGGLEGLLERFRRHFDPTFTAPGADFSDLVRQIPEAVPVSEYREFFRRLLDASGVFGVSYGPELDSEGEALVSHLEELANARVIDAFASELRQDRDLLLATLFFRPTFVANFGQDSIFIHDIWHDVLPLATIGPIQSLLGSLRVFAVMLRTGLIEEGVREVAVRRVVERIDEGPHRSSYPSDLLNELAPFGFWGAVRYHAFEKRDHMLWIAKNLSLAIEYLERHPVDWQVAKTFCGLFPGEIPDVEDYSWLEATKLEEPEDLLNLNYYFHEHPEFFREIVRVAREHELSYEFFERYMNPNNMS